MINTIGWNELLKANLFTAVTVLFQSYYGDWFFTILFLSFKVLLWYSTENVILEFLFSLILITLFGIYFDISIVMLMGTIATFELGIILYTIVFKK